MVRAEADVKTELCSYSSDDYEEIEETEKYPIREALTITVTSHHEQREKFPLTLPRQQPQLLSLAALVSTLDNAQQQQQPDHAPHEADQQQLGATAQRQLDAATQLLVDDFCQSVQSLTSRRQNAATKIREEDQRQIVDFSLENKKTIQHLGNSFSEGELYLGRQNRI